MGRNGEIVRLASGESGRACESHDIRTHHVAVGDLVKFKVFVLEVEEDPYSFSTIRATRLYRFGQLKMNYSLPRDHNRKRGERASTRRQSVKMTVFKFEVVREPTRDGWEYRAIFVPNDRKRNTCQFSRTSFAV
jgi:hypothetical protein